MEGLGEGRVDLGGVDTEKLDTVHDSVLVMAETLRLTPEELGMVCAMVQEEVLRETGLLMIFPESRRRAALAVEGGESDELVSTVRGMLSEDHSERLRAEYRQLAVRYQRLSDMLALMEAGRLSFVPRSPRDLLWRQAQTMHEYLEILRERAAVEEVDLERGAK